MKNPFETLGKLAQALDERDEALRRVVLLQLELIDVYHENARLKALLTPTQANLDWEDE